MLSMHYHYRLKTFVKVADTSAGLVLRNNIEEMLVKQEMGIDTNDLKSNRELRSLASGFEEIIFSKTVSQLIKLDWLDIEIFPGLQIETISPAKWNELKNPKVQTSENYTLSSGLVIETHQNFFRIIGIDNSVVMRVSSELFANISSKKLSPEQKDMLIALQVLNHESASDEFLGEAFHIRTANTGNVLLDPHFKTEIDWHGNFRNSDEKDEFLNTLKNRESITEGLRSPSVEKIRELLNIVYYPTDKKNLVKFSYPSPGRMYSVKIRVIHPDGNVYTYNPLSREISVIGKSNQPISCARIFLLSTDEELKKKYEIIPYRLQLLEAGVILHQISLSVSYCGLKGHILGSLNENRIRTEASGCFTQNEKILAEYKLWES